ncbi:MAG: hypothetical protein IH831_00675 [Planctomycetes bacterium]|nr:hypothetical protein [Planctomycetota bacterium]
MDIKPRKLNVGHFSVVMGNVTGNVGNGSVVIGPTDDRGNTIINTPMAVGRGASAGPGSIAIGAGAHAGVSPQLVELVNQVNQLSDIVEKTEDDATATEFNKLITALEGENGRPDILKVSTIMQQLRSMATLAGAISLVDRIPELLTNLL